MCRSGNECGIFEYSGEVPCAGKLQLAIDAAYWNLLAGLHDIDEGHPTLTHEAVIKSAMRILGSVQLGVG